MRFVTLPYDRQRLRFQIPMRGNETSAVWNRSPSPSGFQIPMRGNELTASLLPWALVSVSNPHEG